MPLAVTHVLLTTILVDLYRDYVTKHKRLFTLWTLFVAGVAGLLPDIDIPVRFVLSNLGVAVPDILHHGGLTHTPFFGLMFLIPALVLWSMKKHKLSVMFFVVTFGVLFHTVLDYAIGGGDEAGLMLLYPLSEDRIRMGVLLGDEFFASVTAMDALILLAWLFHEERKHKIRDFI